MEDYSSDNAVLDGNGNLTIQARKTESGYTSGRVQTKGKESFGYGTLIARIKMPSGRGLWPAFWMVGADEDSNPWPDAGEIDVVEMVSDPYAILVAARADGQCGWDHLQDQIITQGADLSDDFHDYWITRSADSITVGVDDTKWGTFTPDSLPAGATWVFNKPFYVILNLAVGRRLGRSPRRHHGVSRHDAGGLGELGTGLKVSGADEPYGPRAAFKRSM